MIAGSLGKFVVAIGADTSELRKECSAAQAALRKSFGPEALNLSRQLVGGMSLLAAGIGAVGVASIKMSSDMEQTRIAMTTLLGSGEKAKAMLDDLSDLAARTPFEFPELATSAEKLLAFGFTAKEILPALTSIGDAVSGLGGNADMIDRVIKAFGDIKNKGVVQTQEMKQLAENGIAAWDILAKKIGRDIPTVMKMVEDKQISATIGINALMSGINERFGGMMEAQSKTVLGKMSSIKDNIGFVMRDIGESLTKALNIHGALDVALKETQQFAKAVKDVGVFDAISGAFSDRTKTAIVEISAALVGMMLPALIKIAIANTAAFWPLMAPGLIFAGIAAIIYRFEDLQEAVSRSMEAIKSSAASVFYDVKAKFWELVEFVLRGAQRISSAFAEAFTGLPAGISMVGDRISDAFSKITNGIASARGEVIAWKKEAQNKSNEPGFFQNQLKADRGNLVEAQPGEKMTGWAAGLKQAGKAAKKEVEAVFNSISAAFNSTTNQPKSNFMPGDASGGKASDKVAQEARKIQDEIKNMSDSIRREWIQNTKTEREQLDIWYSDQKETLDKNMAANETYFEDLQKLTAIYSAKRFEMDTGEYKKKKEIKEREERERKEAADREIKELQQRSLERQQILNDWSTRAKTGQILEEQQRVDYQNRDIQAYMSHLNTKTAILMQNIAGEKAFMDTYYQFQMEANRSTLSYLSEGMRTAHASLTNSLTNVVMGFQKAGDAAKQLGMEMVQMVVKYMIQRQLASVMLKTMGRAESMAVASSATSTAALVGMAWSKPAALASLATMGANAVPAMAGMGSVMALAKMMSIPALANGGIITKPTIALMGERGPEAVVPLGKGAGGVVVNVINKTGNNISASQVGSRFDGQQTILDIVLDGITRNTGGFRDILKGATR